MNSSRGEYFPVFSWSLFTEVVNPIHSLEVEILRIGETEFAEPVNFFELDEHFEAARHRSTGVWKSGVRILKFHGHDPAAAESARKVFERTYLGDRDVVDYQFVEVVHDPIERWRTGKVLERRVLARFSTERVE